MEDFNFNFEDFFDSNSDSNSDSTVENTNVENKEDKEINFEDLVADIKEEFDSLEEEIAADGNVLAAAAEIVKLEAELVEKEVRHEKVQGEIKEVDSELAKLERQMNALRKRREDLRGDAWDIRTKKNQVEREVTAAKNRKRLAEIEVETRRTQAANEEKYLELAKGKAWWEGININGENFKIMKHQWEGAKFMASSQQSILGDGMGLGKTITSIAALDLVESKRAIIITPAEVTENFRHELNLWAPHRAVVDINGMTRSERRTTLTMANLLDNFVVILNYEAWRKDEELLDLLLDLAPDSLIMDEAHAFKSTGTATYEGVKKLVSASNLCPVDGSILVKREYMDMRECEECGWNGRSVPEFEGLNTEERHYLTRSIKNIWPMTGTPILNAPADFFPLLHVVDPFNFEYKNQYLREYCIQDMYTGAWDFMAGGLESLSLKIKGRYLARTEEDAGIKLPPQKPIVYNLDIDPNQYPDQYQAIVELSKHSQFMLSNQESVSAFNVLSLITRKRQCNVWPGGITIKDEEGNTVLKVSEHIQESIKIDKAMELAQKFLAEGKRVAIFSQFSTALAELNKRMDAKEIRNVRFDGSATNSIKSEVKRNFNKSRGEEAKWDVVLVNYKTGGVGLNLTEVEHTIILDEEWNPGKRDQAYKRTQRIGQDKETFIHILRLNRTIDTWLANLIETKEGLVEGFQASARDMNADLLAALQDGDLL